MNQKPACLDLIILFLFTVLITLQPYFLHHEIIMMDTGIYLPSLHGLFHGQIPYRDILFYRGPFELYVPALSMLFFGQETWLLPAFFYVFSVLTLLAGILLAFQLYRTRFILYLMVPVFVARTFPRVSYYYWGGLRYFIGLLALYLAIQCYKKNKFGWMLWSGIVSALSLLTTLESGVATIPAIVLAMFLSCFWGISSRDFTLKVFKSYVLGLLTVLIPCFLYLVGTGSLGAFLEANYLIPTRIMTTLLYAQGTYPDTPLKFVMALFPGDRFFKVMTPVYFYMVLFVYLIYRIRKKNLGWQGMALLFLAFYGIILYAAAFRKIDGHHFEMALQPQKILFFFLLEEVYLFFRDRKNNILARINVAALKGRERFRALGEVYLFRFFVLALVGSSLGYSMARFDHRFVIAQLAKYKILHKNIEELNPLYGIPTRRLTLERVKGMVVPAWQADEIEGVVEFIKTHTDPRDPVFAYPEVGNFNFWFDRPMVGRFPIGTFAWVDRRWHDELVRDFLNTKPKYVIMTNLGHHTFPAALYFKYPKNVAMFNEMTDLILAQYEPVKSFESVLIYKRKLP